MTNATTRHTDPPSSDPVDVIQEWGEDSFPASDPPASPMTHLGAPHDSAVSDRQRRRSRKARARVRSSSPDGGPS